MIIQYTNEIVKQNYMVAAICRELGAKKNTSDMSM